MQTSQRLAQMPRLPRAEISWVSLICIGSDDLSIEASILLSNWAGGGGGGGACCCEHGAGVGGLLTAVN